jgi:hypothetical protein
LDHMTPPPQQSSEDGHAMWSKAHGAKTFGSDKVSILL